MKLAIEVLIILVISVILGYISSDFLDLIKGALLYAILIVTGLFVYSNKVERDTQSNITTIDEVIDEFIEAQTIILNCPCQKKQHNVFIRPNTDNIIECDECNNEYKIDIQYTPVLLTTPLDPVEVYDKLLKEQEYISKNE